MNFFDIFGAPSSGKSTLAAKLYAKSSENGNKSALVVEAVKDFADRGHKIDNLDHLGILGKQASRELNRIKAGYQNIFTDCPLPMIAFYGGYKYNWFYGDSLLWMALEQERKLAEQYNIKRDRWFLKLKPERFVNMGRYHNLSEAIDIEGAMLEFLAKHEIEFKFYEDSIV